MKRTVVVSGKKIDYSLTRSDRKSYLIKILPGNDVRVWAPAYSHLKDVDAFVCAHAEDIFRMSRQIENIVAESRLRHPVDEGSRICIEGIPYRLHRKKAPRVSMKIEEYECTLCLPDPDDETAVRAALKQTLSRMALHRICERLEEYAPRIGVTYGRVAIRDQRTRWGSCSSKHNLNFNWKLIMAPPEALEYVVIHELCHLIEFNHSPRFWKLVARQMPEYQSWVDWLKAHGKELGVGD